MSLSPPEQLTPNINTSPASSTTPPTPNRIIATIKDIGYLGFIEWANRADSHLNCVHIASFHHPRHGACEAYVKLFDEHPHKQIANEVTNYLCAHALGIPQPEHAFIANIPIAKLRNPPGWVKEKGKNLSKLTAFCTTRLDGASAAVNVPDSALPLLLQDVAGWEHLEQAVALDENIAQTDRHLNNLIRLSRRKFAVIDGGRLATDENGDPWSPTELKVFHLYRNRLSERIWLHKPQQRSIDKMLHVAPEHANLIGQVREELQYWWGKFLQPAEAKAFNDFLLERSHQVELLLRTRYRMLC